MTRVVVPDAIWSWWIQPVAVNDGQTLWLSTVGQDGHNRLHRIADGEVSSVQLSGAEQPDDHNAGAIAIRADNPQGLVFYARHGDDNHIRWRRFDRTSGQVGPQQTLDFGGSTTYAQMVDDGQRLAVLVRRAGQWWYRTTDDWGETWDDRRLLIASSDYGSMYTLVTPHPTIVGRYMLTVAPHPSNSDWTATTFGWVNVGSGQVTDGTGTVLGSLYSDEGPSITPDQLTNVVDGAGDSRTRLLDVRVVNQVPHVVYAIWEGVTGDPSYEVRRLQGGEFVGAGWSWPSGDHFGWTDDSRYVGGAVFDRDGSIWTSRQDNVGRWWIEHHPRSGSGWGSPTVVDDSTDRLLRPYVPAGDGRGRVVWQHVTSYGTYQEYAGQAVALLTPDPADPGEQIDPVARAEIRRRVTWLACDAVTGQIVVEVPDVTVDDVSRLLGAYTTTKATLPIPTVGPRNFTLSQRATLAERATVPRRTMIVAVVNDLPAWAGLVVRRVSGTGPNLELSLVTLEGYFDRRTVRNLTFSQVDQSIIVRDLLRQAEDIGGVGQGLGFDYQVTLSGVLRDRRYVASDRASIYRRVRELMGVQGGPEWTVDLDWTDADKTAIRKIVRIGPRIGVAAAEPHALFQTTAQGVFSAAGSSSATYTLTEDYSDGRGANWVEAYAPGEGDDQPSSEPHVDGVQLDAGAPIFERHWQPSSSIETVETLNGHAAAELERLRDGSRLFEIEARWDAYPRYGVDWRLGDDIAWELVGHAHPDGLVGQGRAIGWSLDMGAGLIRPKLLDPSGEVSV